MKFTTEDPTEEGYYWVAYKDSEPSPTFIKLRTKKDYYPGEPYYGDYYAIGRPNPDGPDKFQDLVKYYGYKRSVRMIKPEDYE